jgi:hypothetical protein
MANRTFDANTEILDVDGSAISASGSTTPVAIQGFLGDESYIGVVNIVSNAGTVDASNYFTLGLEVSSDDTNYYPVGNVVSTWNITDSTAQTGTLEIAFTGNQATEAAQGTAPTKMAVVAVKTGTTQTSVTAGAYIGRS